MMARKSRELVPFVQKSLETTSHAPTSKSTEDAQMAVTKSADGREWVVTKTLSEVREYREGLARDLIPDVAVARVVEPAPASPLAWKKQIAQHHLENIALVAALLSALSIYAVAFVLTYLSLHHLSAGIEKITHADHWEALFTAVGIDIGMIAMEVSMLVTSLTTRTVINPWTQKYIIGTLIWSAGMNALIFASQADGIGFQGIAIAIGVSLPAAIYVCMHVGSKILIHVLD
jgi:hypothetical protein